MKRLTLSSLPGSVRIMLAMYKVLTEVSRIDLLSHCGNVSSPPKNWSETRLQAWSAIGALACAHKDLIKRILIVKDPPEPPRGEIHVALPDTDTWALIQLGYMEVEPSQQPAQPFPLELLGEAEAAPRPELEDCVAFKVDVQETALLVRALVQGKSGRILQRDLWKTAALPEEQERQRIIAFTQALARAQGAFYGRFIAYLDQDR
ncbi:hypothetical protein [Hyalangium rubrum]|uniref:Protein kinase domain-containing protein n=1 Tax=Hyalangium rubrum TaxID=3103134 RepID=A0ABU5HFQ1_9BACT|nr:hypothetical protein [Hyalangium sp. s54d21]MDY7232278.1 hypothetical protein [Hyalangium sp. s54d21]